MAGVCLPTQDHEGLSGQIFSPNPSTASSEAEQMDQQESSAIETYLNEMPKRCFPGAFNGIDLTGWQGWFADPYTLKTQCCEKKIRQERQTKDAWHWKAKRWDDRV